MSKSVREALGLKVGDALFFRYDPKNNRLQTAPAVSTFDILTEYAVREYKEGRVCRDYRRVRRMSGPLKLHLTNIAEKGLTTLRRIAEEAVKKILVRARSRPKGRPLKPEPC